MEGTNINMGEAKREKEEKRERRTERRTTGRKKRRKKVHVEEVHKNLNHCIPTENVKTYRSDSHNRKL